LKVNSASCWFFCTDVSDAVQQNIKFKQPVLSRPSHISLTIMDMVFASV